MSIAALHDTPIGDPVTGVATKLREAQITVVNADGTVQARALNGRKSWEGLGVAKWYAPALGDVVLVAAVDGLAQRPLVICPLVSAGGGVPHLLAPRDTARSWVWGPETSVAIGEVLGFPIVSAPSESQRLIGVYYRTQSGAAEAQLKLEGNVIAGPFSATTTPGMISTTVSLTAGEWVALDVISSTAKGMAVVPAIERR